MSHVTGINESRHTFNESRLFANESTRIWMSHVTGINKSRQTYEWVYVWHDSLLCDTNTWAYVPLHLVSLQTCHSTHMNESCHTHERVMSHTWMSHVTSINEVCHTHTHSRVVSHISMIGSMSAVGHATCVPWLIHIPHVTHVACGCVMRAVSLV